ncbi:hypothetical protein LEP1GSC161_2629 [Leptospira santarosai str. CBC1416]|uniref:Uncharacterized protein n=1 Tax=Leptospira santarosai str. CBC1416 TaxID=1193059 RepID=M6VKB7_9LEPT|nr:hypothetical protein LEP1GSC161_2629 [Leptospira santarosai str. CBC1416]
MIFALVVFFENLRSMGCHDDHVRDLRVMFFDLWDESTL